MKKNKVFNQDSGLVNPQTAADMLGLEKETLAVWRCTKRYDLAYLKIGGNIAYERREINRFIAASRCK